MKIKGIHAAPALLIIVSALTVASNFLDLSALSENTNPYLTLMVLQICAIGIPTVFFSLLRGAGHKKRLGLKLFPPSQLAVSLYGLLAILFSNIALSLLMYRFFPEAFAASAMTAKSSEIAAIGQVDTLYAAVAFGILPAVLEEFLFRGVIFAEYAPYGGGVAVIMSALCFSLLHFNPVRLPIYLACGLILGMIRAATGSIFPSLIIHTANNLFVLYFESYIYKVAGKHSGGMTLLAFMVVCALIVCLALMFASLERIYRRRGERGEESPLVLRRKEGDLPAILQSLIAPTFIIFVIFYLVTALVLQP